MRNFLIVVGVVTLILIGGAVGDHLSRVRHQAECERVGAASTAVSRDLLTDLGKARARVAQLERAVRQASCREVGHDWKSIGGCNAGCRLGKDCGCSVPVHECTKCGDCDYGDNDWAEKTRTECEARQ